MTNRMRSELDNAVPTFKTRVYDAKLAAKDSLAIPKLELAIKDVNASTGQNAGKVVFDPHHRVSSRVAEGIQMTAPGKLI